jgi:signal transduction histidine kinase
MSIAWLLLILTLGQAAYVVASWRRRGDARDLHYAFILLAWAVLLWAGQLAGPGWPDEWVRNLTRGAYQLTILGVAAFLMSWVRNLSWADRLLVGGQAVAGLLLAPWHAESDWGRAWFWVNTLCAMAIVLRLGYVIWQRADAESWMVLLVAMLGLGVVLTDLRQAGDGPVAVSVPHYFFAVALFVLWLFQNRLKPRAEDAGAPAQQLKRLLAQELHDGVGSQLTTIISALDAGSPEQRATAATLQQCLLELKLLVDGLSEEGSVVSHLASLRYRMQPLLASAGMDLRWRLVGDEVLEQAQGPAARQVLRIAQEALANAVRHSGGDTVLLSCCHQAMNQALLMEVWDNGQGMPRERDAHASPAATDQVPAGGKGLTGMALRAQRIGGQLTVESQPGQGTRVRLRVPMAAFAQPSGADRRPAP